MLVKIKNQLINMDYVRNVHIRPEDSRQGCGIVVEYSDGNEFSTKYDSMDKCKEVLKNIYTAHIKGYSYTHADAERHDNTSRQKMDKQPFGGVSDAC